jgi:hypothetical protein
LFKSLAEVDTLGVGFFLTSDRKFRNFGKIINRTRGISDLFKGLNFGMDLTKYKLDERLIFHIILLLKNE